MYSRSTPSSVMAMPCPWRGFHALHPAASCTLISSLHYCNAYWVPLASVPVRWRTGVRCVRIFAFMAGAFRLVLRNPHRKGQTPATPVSRHVARITGGPRQMTANSSDARKACARSAGIFFFCVVWHVASVFFLAVFVTPNHP